MSVSLEKVPEQNPEPMKGPELLDALRESVAKAKAAHEEKREWQSGDFVIMPGNGPLNAYYGFIYRDRYANTFALHYLSGVKAHNIRTQADAEQLGWAFLSERDSGETVPLTFHRLGAYAETSRSMAEDLARLRDRVGKAELAVDNLKATVRSVAMELAKEHNWCGVVRDALNDMGIPTTRTVTVTFSGEFSFTPDDDEDGVDAYSIAAALSDADASDIEISSYRITGEEWSE